MLEERGIVPIALECLGVLILIALPVVILKLVRPKARPVVMRAAEQHIERCKVTVMTTEEFDDEESGGKVAKVFLNMPEYWKTNMHRDYIAGVGLAL